MRHIIEAATKRIEEAAKRPGETWKTASGKYAGKNKEGTTRYYSDQSKAKDFAKGKSSIPKPSNKTPQPLNKTQEKNIRKRIEKLKDYIEDWETDLRVAHTLEDVKEARKDKSPEGKKKLRRLLERRELTKRKLKEAKETLKNLTD